MALRVSDIATENYTQQMRKQNTTTGTTITPFSKMMEEETKKVNEENAASSTQTASQTASAANVAKTTGTTGTVKSDGTLTTTLDDIFKRASEKYGVSYDFLVAVAKAESDFNPKCVSSAGAKGIMQIMPYEAKELGVEDVYDAEQNIMASAKLLAAHLKKFNGDTTLAAAAYNAGSGRVKQYGGVPPFTETQNYVKKIAKYMEEGVKVPDKTVTVIPNKLSGDVTKSQSTAASASPQTEAQTTQTTSVVQDAAAATDEELNQTMVAVGSGASAVTMTYGAYQRYLELGSLGVG
ncbi:lytic transglycosylase [Roseburia sp. CAG:309]|nr:lytic transglycosylase [Roseburia sp. CAG:309]